MNNYPPAQQDYLPVSGLTLSVEFSSRCKLNFIDSFIYFGNTTAITYFNDTIIYFGDTFTYLNDTIIYLGNLSFF